MPSVTPRAGPQISTIAMSRSKKEEAGEEIQSQA